MLDSGHSQLKRYHDASKAAKVNSLLGAARDSVHISIVRMSGSSHVGFFMLFLLKGRFAQYPGHIIKAGHLTRENDAVEEKYVPCDSLPQPLQFDCAASVR